MRCCVALLISELLFSFDVGRGVGVTTSLDFGLIDLGVIVPVTGVGLLFDFVCLVYCGCSFYLVLI